MIRCEGMRDNRITVPQKSIAVPDSKIPRQVPMLFEGLDRYIFHLSAYTIQKSRRKYSK